MSMPSQLDRTVWLADLTHTGRGTATDTVPLGISLIAAYTGTQFTLAAPIRLFRYPETLADALRRDGVPDLIGFAGYVWNTTLSRRFAQAIKRRSPNTIVVFGGPNFPLRPSDQRAWLAIAPEIDFVVEREGETAFAGLLAELAAAQWRPDNVHGTVPGTLSIDRHGVLHRGPVAPRLRDLSVIPSPYLNGSMDEFLDGRLVPTIQTNRGCPFSCSFCLEGDSYYSRVSFFPTERLTAELEYIAERMLAIISAGGRNELMITDSNFAMFGRDSEICAAIGSTSQRFGWPARVNVTTGKNRRDRVLAAVSRANGTIEVSGAVQSLDRTVLENINRATIDTTDLIAVAQRASTSKARTYSDVILGLPGDTIESHVTTVTTLIDGGFGRVNTFQFALLDGAEANTPETRTAFGIRTMFRVLPRDFGQYRVFDEEIVCGEIDEICVSSDTLSFNEYLQARAFDLTTFLFHNDAIFAMTEAALSSAGGTPGSWITAIHRLARWAGRLEDLRHAYLSDTREQLFESNAQAHRDVAHHLASYLDGTRGNNLLYSYRARALVETVDDIARTALDGLAALAGVLGPEGTELVTQAVEFDRLRLSGIPDLIAGTRRRIEATFDYDFRRLVRGGQPEATAVLRRSPPILVRFEPSPNGHALMGNYRSVMGHTADGIGRMLTRVPIEEFTYLPVYPHQSGMNPTGVPR